MAMKPVPDFFQEEDEKAIRHQVSWLMANMELNAIFFSKFLILALPDRQFQNWQKHDGVLDSRHLQSLLELWRGLLHLLSFMNFNVSHAIQFLNHVPDTSDDQGSMIFPPWHGQSLKSYLAQNGCVGVNELHRWLSSFRFGDPYRKKAA